MRREERSRPAKSARAIPLWLFGTALDAEYLHSPSCRLTDADKQIVFQALAILQSDLLAHMEPVK